MTTQQHEENHPGKLRKALKVLFAVCFVGVVAAIAFYWLSNPPQAQRRGKKKDKIRLVETTQVKPFTKRMTVEAMGTVVPVDDVELTARVSGRITEVNSDLVPGSPLEKGETLATVEQEDYRLALEQAKAAFGEAKLIAKERKLAIEQRKSEIARAEKELTLEKARQDVARAEYELLGADSGLLMTEKVPVLPDLGVDTGKPQDKATPEDVRATFSRHGRAVRSFER